MHPVLTVGIVGNISGQCDLHTAGLCGSDVCHLDYIGTALCWLGQVALRSCTVQIQVKFFFLLQYHGLTASL